MSHRVEDFRVQHSDLRARWDRVFCSGRLVEELGLKEVAVRKVQNSHCVWLVTGNSIWKFP